MLIAVKRGVDAAGQQLGVGLGVAAEGNVEALDAGVPEQQLGRQMRLRADARRSKGQSVGPRLAVGDQLGQVLEARLGVDDQEDRRQHGHRHRLQVLALVGQFAEQRFRGRIGRRRVEEGVAVARGMRDELVGEAGARARPVLDDELLAETIAEILGKDPQRDVVGPAGPVGRYHPDIARGPIALRESGQGRACGKTGGDGAQQVSARQLQSRNRRSV